MASRWRMSPAPCAMARDAMDCRMPTTTEEGVTAPAASVDLHLDDGENVRSEIEVFGKHGHWLNMKKIPYLLQVVNVDEEAINWS